jgi:hypothetical protein
VAGPTVDKCCIGSSCLLRPDGFALPLVVPTPHTRRCVEEMSFRMSLVPASSRMLGLAFRHGSKGLGSRLAVAIPSQDSSLLFALHLRMAIWMGSTASSCFHLEQAVW